MTTRTTIEFEAEGVSPRELRRLSSSAWTDQREACGSDPVHPRLRVGVSTESDGLFDDLASWLEEHLPHTLRALDLERVLEPKAAFASDGAGSYLHVLVLDAKAAERFDSWPTLAQTSLGPEVILVGAPGLVAARFRENGVSVAGEIYGPWSLDQLGRVVLCAVDVRLSLRSLGRRLVGRVPLRDAVQLLRHSMLVTALANNGSKRSTARLLGVTRPAVQSMAKLLSVPHSVGIDTCHWST